MQTERTIMIFDNRTYDILKYIALIALPAIQVFWLTIGKIWNISYTVEIGATIGAVALLLGTLLRVSNTNYLAEKEQDNYNDDEFLDMIEGEENEDTEDLSEE